ncbi:MAG: hypothetical protein QM677_02075 [Microbacterium sp.]
MFGLTLEKLVLVAIFAGIVLGPQRLASYTRRLSDTVRSLRAFVEATRRRAEQDLGVPLTRAEWEELDLRQYDPRRVVREALADGVIAPSPAAATTPSAGAGGVAVPDRGETAVADGASAALETDAAVAVAPAASAEPAALERVAALAGNAADAPASPLSADAASGESPSSSAEPAVRRSYEGLDRVRPGQKYLVLGDSAHPRRILLASLPADDPRRLVAEYDPTAHAAARVEHEAVVATGA